MIFSKFWGWDECSFEDYADCCELYGYNSESSARFLKFLVGQGASLRFLALRQKGERVGAVCLDNGWLANDHKNPKTQTAAFPLPSYSILPPFKDGVRCFAPFKTKSLSDRNHNFINTSFNLLSKRRVAYARCVSDGFSAKTRSTRNREIRRFLAAGGEFVSVADVSSDYLHDSYQQLFAKRREREVEQSAPVKAFFAAHHDDFFGQLALLNGEPVGIQLLLSSTSRLGFFVDFINIGYETAITEHSLGTIMMWNNLVVAEQQARTLARPLYFSYGMMSGEYKTRWCTPSGTGRVIAF